MITREEVLERLKSKKPCEITAMQNEHKKLLMHVHGVDVAGYLAQIEGLENDTKIELRKKLARSNKDLFADILRPTDKIFNSQGGSKVYTFTNQKSKQELTEKLSDIVDGYSLSKWLQMFFVDKIVVDPNGLFLVEHKDNEAYPTYKSILSIYDYKCSGRGVDWIIFEPIKHDSYETVRVYDETGDYTYKYSDNSLTLIEEYENPWGYVPAFLCSDRINPLTGKMQSFIYEQVELADEYLRENSIKTIFKYHHGFPMFWQYAPTCKSCGGTGFTTDGKICPVCKGSKHAFKKDVSDITYLKQPSKAEEPTIAPDIAGYVVPPIESWQQMTEELKMLRDMIYFSHWGTVINREDTEKTAFEVALNTQPMQDRLNQYTNTLESTERYFIDIISQYYFTDYKGCSINYGRNYIIKSPNQYLKEYLEEKEQKASYSVLNGKLEMYYNALYANDEYNRTVSTKLMYVEPFVHNELSDVVTWNVSTSLVNEKIYFNQWLSSIDKDSVLSKTIPELQAELSAFALGKSNQNTNRNEPEKVQRV